MQDETKPESMSVASPIKEKELWHFSKRKLTPILLSLLLVVTSLFIYDKYFAVKIVALDFKGFVAEQRNLVLSKKIDEVQFRKNIDTLERTVMSVPKNHVVLMGDAVLGHVEKIEITKAQ